MQEKSQPQIGNVLSPKELAIVSRGRLGMTVKEIAHELGLSDDAIRKRMQKMHLETGLTIQELSLWYDAESQPEETVLQEAHQAMEGLIEDEKKILRLLGVGFPDDRIGETLGLSAPELRTYQRKLILQLGIREDLGSPIATCHIATALGVLAHRAMSWGTENEPPLLTSPPIETIDRSQGLRSLRPDQLEVIGFIRDGSKNEQVASARFMRDIYEITGLNRTKLILQYDREFPPQKEVLRQAYMSLQYLKPEFRNTMYLLGKGISLDVIAKEFETTPEVISARIRRIAKKLLMRNRLLDLSLMASRAARWAETYKPPDKQLLQEGPGIGGYAALIESNREVTTETLLDLIIAGNSFEEVTKHSGLSEDELRRTLSEITKDQSLLANCLEREKKGGASPAELRRASLLYDELIDLHKELAPLIASGYKDEYIVRQAKAKLGVKDMAMHRSLIMDHFNVKNTIALAILLARVEKYEVSTDRYSKKYE